MPATQTNSENQPAREPGIPAGPVRLMDQGGQVMGRDEAVAQARAQGLELVCFNPRETPPLCKFGRPANPPPPARRPLQASEAPTPLALALREFGREAQPFRKVHRLIDAIEVFIKLHTVVVVSDLFSAENVGEETRGKLAVGLKQPSLGVWWMWARDFAGLSGGAQNEAGALVPGMVDFLGGGNLAIIDGLVAFRNRYAHGATPDDEACREDIAICEPRLRALLASAAHLREAVWVRVDAAGQCHQAVGENPAPIAPPGLGLAPGRIYVARGGRVVSLHPLLVYLPEPGGFFFYNDLRKTAAHFLNYELATHRQDEPLRAALLERYPIDQWARAAPVEFAQRVGELTETFMGRKEDLRRLLGFAEAQPRGFLMVWGGPGLGKSALLARCFQILKWPPEMRAAAQLEPACPADGPVHLLEYFIRRAANRTDSPDFFLDNLSQRLDRLFPTGQPAGNTTAERQRGLAERLDAISRQLAGHGRLVLLIDGLDEAADSPGFLDCLPKSVPGRVLVIYSSRPHPRVRDRVYGALDRERCEELALAGLGAGEVRAILSGQVSKYGMEPGYLQEVARRSQGNPLYLNLLAQGLGRGDFSLNDATALPAGMGSIYGRILERLGSIPHAVELLQLLAAARDFVSAAMASQILGLPGDLPGTQLFPACRELLEENPLTGQLEDYQLFHESLRDYLRGRYPGECRRLDRQLYAWCLEWPRLAGESRCYALRHLAAHAAAVLAEPGLPAAALAAELDRLHGLAACGAYQQASFEELGEGSGYQAHCRLLLERLPDSGAARRAERGMRALWSYHTQPERRRAGILRQIDRGADGLQRLEQFAAMGRTPRERALLALRGLAARPGERVPPGLRKRLGQWCEDAASKALTALCLPHLNQP